MKWLSTLEQQAWIGLLASATGLVFAGNRQLQADAGVGFDTYAVLAALSESPKLTLHMSELGGIAGHSQSRLSHAAARLERDGLIRRSECSADKRAVHATLTRKGLNLVRSAAPQHVSAVRQLVFDRLTPEQTQSLAEITNIIYSALVAEGYVPPLVALTPIADREPDHY